MWRTKKNLMQEIDELKVEIAKLQHTRDNLIRTVWYAQMDANRLRFKEQGAL